MVDRYKIGTRVCICTENNQVATIMEYCSFEEIMYNTPCYKLSCGKDYYYYHEEIKLTFNTSKKYK